MTHPIIHGYYETFEQLSDPILARAYCHQLMDEGYQFVDGQKLILTSDDLALVPDDLVVWFSQKAFPEAILRSVEISKAGWVQ